MSASATTAPRRALAVLIVAAGGGVAVLVLVMALVLANASDAVAAGVAAAGVSGAVSVALAVVSLLDRQRESEERSAIRKDESDERMSLREQELRERLRNQREERVLQALDYFTGHTQRRNVGIAVLEGYLQLTPKLRDVVLPMLANQAVYLLEQSDEVDSVNEADNCRRIMALLLESGDISEALVPSYQTVQAALGRAGHGKKGVKISAHQRGQWATQLEQLLAGR